MIKKILLLAATAVLFINNPAAAEGLTISHPAYAFETAEGQKNGAVFVSIKNAGTSARQLTAVQVGTDIAAMTELHTMEMRGDIMKMAKVDSFEIPAGGELTLQPAGNHIMVMGLNKPLAKKTSFPVTIIFDGEEKLEVPVEIVQAGFKADVKSDHTHP